MSPEGVGPFASFALKLAHCCLKSPYYVLGRGRGGHGAVFPFIIADKTRFIEREKEANEE
jgi:hypothetical protein